MEDLRKEILSVYRRTDEAIGAFVDDLRQKSEGAEDEIKQSVEGIMSEMNQKHSEFKKQVDELERDSEFEKFTIAFFGQTNAGKSTIIEALRILFDEESRANGIKCNLEEQQRLREKSRTRTDDVIQRLEELKKAYNRPPVLRKIAAYAIWCVVGIVLGLVLAWRFS